MNALSILGSVSAEYNLTLTRVVFELVMIVYHCGDDSHLTLTRVVFEYVINWGQEPPFVNLTLTRVVFELGRCGYFISTNKI